MMVSRSIAGTLVAVLSLLLLHREMVGAEETAGHFEIRDGDRVVFLGGGLIERAQQFGYWETMLTLANSDRNATFRNVGWSGDTVWGESRGMFEPHLGYERLIEQVQATDPTLLIIAYGNNEAFAGEKRVDEFVAQYAKLLADLKSESRRFVLVSPFLMEAAKLPDNPDAPADFLEHYNRNVEIYSDAIAALADDNGCAFLDLLSQQRAAQETDDSPLTSNGFQITGDGYRRSAAWLVKRGSSTENVSEMDWDSPAVMELRKAIVAKNRLFFHRWRPQNFTYLFGFRKHEQGQNAVEIPQFDPLVEKADQHIAQLLNRIRSKQQ